MTGERDLSEQSAGRADLGDSRVRECADVVLDGWKIFRQVRRAHGEHGGFLSGPVEDCGQQLRGRVRQRGRIFLTTRHGSCPGKGRHDIHGHDDLPRQINRMQDGIGERDCDARIHINDGDVRHTPADFALQNASVFGMAVITENHEHSAGSRPDPLIQDQRILVGRRLAQRQELAVVADQGDGIVGDALAFRHIRRAADQPGDGGDVDQTLFLKSQRALRAQDFQNGSIQPL